MKLRIPASLFLVLCCAAPGLAVTRNILLTGYWPPTNDMVRNFSTNPVQNPNGWQGANWEGRGYNVHSYFPEFPGGVLNEGEGDLMVDYQDTSQDWWRIVDEVDPVAIITFSRTGNNAFQWEFESRQRNLQTWVNDFVAPFQPTPSPPDASVPADFIRFSSLPMQQMVTALQNTPGLILSPFIDMTDFGGGFLSEFIAYHGTWYHDLHASPSDPNWNIAAGHVHVGGGMQLTRARTAMQVTLRELITYVDTQIPEPTTAGLILVALFAAPRALRR